MAFYKILCFFGIHNYDMTLKVTECSIGPAFRGRMCSRCKHTKTDYCHSKYDSEGVWERHFGDFVAK